MFYNQLIKLCEEHNEKPTPLLKSLGLSATNLKRWQNSSTVNSDILAKLSGHFDVPVDYFFEDCNSGNSMVISDDGNSIKKVYRVMAAHPDHIASMISGTDISFADLNRIATYMNCSVDYLVPEGLLSGIKSESKSDSAISDKDYILNILEKLAGNAEYSFLQVRISSIILSHLAKKNITIEKLLAIKLASKKIRNLYDLEMPAEKKKA